MSRNIYFIDTENIGSDFINSLKFLDKSDTVCIFYSNFSKNISYKHLEDLRSLKCKLETYPIYLVNKNYLDFQIATVLGAKAQQYPTYGLFVVSNDKGFQSVVDFWRMKGYLCDLITAIGGSSPSATLEEAILTSNSRVYGNLYKQTKRSSLRASMNSILGKSFSESLYSTVLEVLENTNSADEFRKELLVKYREGRVSEAIHKELSWNYPVLLRHYKQMLRKGEDKNDSLSQNSVGTKQQ